MILEVAVLNVRSGPGADFEKARRTAEPVPFPVVEHYEGVSPAP